MRLNPNVGVRHLTLTPDVAMPIIGIAEAVALAAARGPGGLPPGIADAVLRLAFGRGAVLPPAAEQRSVNRGVLRLVSRTPEHG